MAGGPDPVLLHILLIILGAKLGGELFERMKQPAVLGELLVGVALGASLLGGYVGMPDFAVLDAGDKALKAADAAFFLDNHASLDSLAVLSALASLGAILLLFEVGLESNIRDLTKVGVSSIFVAILGIVVSFGAGYGASWLLTKFWSPWQAASAALPASLLHLFVGATLTATSVGITARVLGDMGKLRTTESRIILGAAVLDDIAGLLILAIIGAMAASATSGEPLLAMDIVKIAGSAVGFLLISLVVGLKTVPPAYDYLVEKFKVKGFPVALAIAFALAMAYFASVFGLADIVGAFAGGLLLAQTRHHHQIFTDLRPIAAIFVSFFFVTLGMKVDLSRMEGYGAMVLAIGIGLGVLAILAKLTCGWGVQKRTANRLIVGVGMAPRGEVGLIFAALGLSTGLITNWQYTALIVVVLITTFVTPIWLQGLRSKFRPDLAPDGSSQDNLGKVLEA